MPGGESFLVFVGAGLLLNITPGPDVLYIVARSVSQGRMAGIVSALGIGVGCIFHVLMSAFGLSALLMAFPVAFDVIRYAGAAYLCYLGVRMMLTRQDLLDPSVVPPAPLGRIFLQGVITDVLNPKVALFFLAFLPQFVDPSRGPVVPQFLLLGLVFNINGALVCLAYALVASSLGGWLRRRWNGAMQLNRVAGGVLVLLGLRLALLSRR